MDLRLVECLCCGQTRRVPASALEHDLEHPECPRCGYLGWAVAGELTERERRAFRAYPPEHRRLRIA